MLSAGEVTLDPKNKAAADTLVLKTCDEVAAGTADKECTEPFTTTVQDHMQQLQGADEQSQFALSEYVNLVKGYIGNGENDCYLARARETMEAARAALANTADKILADVAKAKFDSLPKDKLQCARRDFLSPTSIIEVGEKTAFQRALRIKQSDFRNDRKPTSEDAKNAKKYLIGLDTTVVDSFDNIYARAAATLTDDELANFDAALYGAAIERFYSGPTTGTIFTYRGRTFDDLTGLMTYASIVAQDLTTGEATIESLDLPGSVSIALDKIPDAADIRALARAIYFSALDNFYASANLHLSEFYGSALAKIINDNASDVTKLRQILSENYLDALADLQPLPSILRRPEGVGLATGTTIPANLSTNLKRLWFEALRKAPKDSNGDKIAEGVAVAVSGMQLEDPAKLAEQLSYMRVDKVTDASAAGTSFDVSLVVATATPEWLRMVLGITDIPRTIALDYVWKQVVDGTPEGKHPYNYLASLAEHLKPYAQRTNSLLRVIVAGLNPDKTLNIVLMPREVHERGGRNIMDARNPDASAAADFNRNLSEEYLKARKANQGFSDDTSNTLSVANMTASNLSSAAIIGRRPPDGSEPYTVEFKEWKDGQPVFDKKEDGAGNPFNLSAEVSLAAINKKTALLFTVSASKRFGAAKDADGWWWEPKGVLVGGNEITKTTEHRHDLLVGPSEPTVGSSSTGVTDIHVGGGRNYRAKNSQNLLGLAGDVGAPVDGLLSISGNGRYARYAEDGKQYFSLTLSDRIGKNLGLNPDWVLTNAAGEKRFVLGNYANILKLSAELAVFGKLLSLKPSVGYMTNIGVAPEKIVFSFGTNSVFPGDISLNTSLAVNNTLGTPASKSVLTAAIERPFKPVSNLTVSPYLSSEAVLVGGTNKTDATDNNEDPDVVRDPDVPPPGGDVDLEIQDGLTESSAPDFLFNLSGGGKLAYNPKGGPIGLIFDLGGDLLGPGFEDTFGFHVGAGVTITLE